MKVDDPKVAELYISEGNYQRVLKFTEKATSRLRAFAEDGLIPRAECQDLVDRLIGMFFVVSVRHQRGRERKLRRG